MKATDLAWQIQARCNRRHAAIEGTPATLIHLSDADDGPSTQGRHQLCKKYINLHLPITDVIKNGLRDVQSYIVNIGGPASALLSATADSRSWTKQMLRPKIAIV